MNLFMDLMVHFNDTFMEHVKSSCKRAASTVCKISLSMFKCEKNYY